MPINDLQVPLTLVVRIVTSSYGPMEKRDEAIVKGLREGSLNSAIEMGVEYLHPIVQAIPELSIFDEKMHAFAGGWTRRDHRNVCRALIHRAIEVGCEEAVGELEKYVSDDTFTVQQMLFIGGVRISTEIELSSGIRLIPFQQENTNQIRFIPRRMDGTRLHQDITLIIIKQFLHARTHKTSLELEDSPTSVMPELWNFDELEDALLCLTLGGPSGPAVIATSITPAQWVPILAGPLGQGTAPVDIRQITEFKEADFRRIQDIHRQFVTLPPNARTRLRVPMRRLNLAMRRKWDVDAAIDIGIALEVLFSGAKPPDGSFGFTLRLRASRLFRQDAQERIGLSRVLSDLYKLRSSAAHSGELPLNVGGVKSTDLLQKGAEIVSEAISWFIANQEPDWDTVVFG